MTPETEKLAEALKAWDGVIMHSELWDSFQNKYNENPCTVVVNAARQFAEVLPLFERVDNIVTLLETGQNSTAHYEALHVKEQIAAILARDEERKQSDE